MKLNNTILLMCFLFVFLIPHSSYAEFYKFTDKNGNVRFTDNLNDIPVSERPNTEKYNELEYQEKKQDHMESEPRLSKKERFEKNLSTLDKRNEYHRIIKAEENKLNDEFLLLIKEKNRLQKQDKQTDNIKEYNDDVLKLNELIKAYDVKRRALQKKINEYNDVVNHAHKEN